MSREGSYRWTPLEVEWRLVRHYLHTDGPGGAGPLRYIDASDLELAEVFGTSIPSDAIAILYDGCNCDGRIARVLSEGWQAHWPDPRAPGFFRYLILTCTVVALADMDKNSQEFSRNLQRLFNTTRSFSSRRALPDLWDKLAEWCEIRRKQGEPIRQFDLPERGPGIHLGLTNAISFPNWRDVLHMRNELERRGRIVQRLENPTDAARLLCPSVTVQSGYTPAMIAAAREYYDLYLSRASLLHLHPFWATVCRALHLSRSKTHRHALSIRIELELAALAEDTELSVSAHDAAGGTAVDSPAPYVYKLEEAIKRMATWGADLAAASRWRQAFTSGAIAFAQERFGVWTASEAAPSSHNSWLYLIEARRKAALQAIPFGRQRWITSGWLLVGPYHGVDALEVHTKFGLPQRGASEGAAPPFLFEDGVRTSVGWLGRIALLPRIWRQSAGSIELLPCDEETVSPRMTDIGGGWSAIEANYALDGSYRVRLEEGVHGTVALAIESRVRFVADSPEHPHLASPSLSWRDEPEYREAALTEELRANHHCDVQLCGHDEASLQRFDDFLELLYARGRRGWAESDLVAAVATILPGPSPWDIIRALQEGGWVRRTVSVSWRASRWWLVHPHLVPLSSRDDGPVMLGGAAPSVVRRRFTSTTTTLGGRTAVRSGLGPMSPVIVIATGVDVERLATELGWPKDRPRLAQGLTAPACWPVADVDVGQHHLHREWDWMFGRFIDQALLKQKYPVSLTWWRRMESDRPDLYLVESRSKLPFTTSSRPMALAEAFRQARQPMFELEGSTLLRCSKEGHLPLHLAQALGLLTLRRGGPIRIGDAWTYSYLTCKDGTALVSSCLGNYFLKTSAVPDAAYDAATISSVVGRARHRGGRPSGRPWSSVWI